MKNLQQKLIKLIFLISLSFTNVISAQEISADLVNISTPVYTANTSSYAPALGKYTYQVGWQGIPAAECTVEVQREGLFYHITAGAKTNKGIDLFYKLRYHAEGVMSAVDYRPKKTSVMQTENSRQKITEVTYLDSGLVKSYRINPKGKEDRLVFQPKNFMLEPFSAAFLARSLDWQKGVSREFDTFNGKSRYLLKLTAKDRITMKVNGKPRDVWVIVPEVNNLTNPKKNKKLRSAEIYVSADENKEILQIKSEVFIGSVYATLKNFESSGDVKGPVTFLARAGESEVLVQ